MHPPPIARCRIAPASSFLPGELEISYGTPPHCSGGETPAPSLVNLTGIAVVGAKAGDMSSIRAVPCSSVTELYRVFSIPALRFSNAWRDSPTHGRRMSVIFRASPSPLEMHGHKLERPLGCGPSFPVEGFVARTFPNLRLQYRPGDQACQPFIVPTLSQRFLTLAGSGGRDPAAQLAYRSRCKTISWKIDSPRPRSKSRRSAPRASVFPSPLGPVWRARLYADT
jgi:hypothetical protein